MYLHNMYRFVVCHDLFLSQTASYSFSLSIKSIAFTNLLLVLLTLPKMFLLELWLSLQVCAVAILILSFHKKEKKILPPAKELLLC